jgi:hypothetical protein
MSKVKALAFAALATALFCCARVAPAQISINFGVEPVCPYGYFDYAPYDCAPYGYYGPDWFVNGVFIGAGRWFHGAAFTAMSTGVLIPITVTGDRCLSAAKSPSTTSTPRSCFSVYRNSTIAVPISSVPHPFRALFRVPQVSL